MTPLPRWGVFFYQDARGRMPADEWIHTLQGKDQARVFKTIELLKEYGVQLTMPHARHLTGKLWELRVAVGRNDYRILYAAVVGRRFLLLHGFPKKTPKTPPSEIEIAEGRLRDYLARTKET